MIPQTVEFIRELYQSKEFIPLHAPVFFGKELTYVQECVESGWVSSVGKFVDKLEIKICEIVGSNHAVAVVNGTAGLHVALQAVGVKSGEEVITQSLTFVATANAISYIGAKPIFCDVDIDTMGLSPQSVESFLVENCIRDANGNVINKQSGARISAIVPMHTFGFPVRIDELVSIAKEWGIPVVEDAAESLGSYFKGRHTGTFGELGVFSFNGNKIVTAGGGGAVVTNESEASKKIKHITTTAKKSHPYEYDHDVIGFNYRMPNINAGLALGQIENLEIFLESKRKTALEYQKFFSSIGVKFRTEMPNTKANYWLMCIELEDFEQRQTFLEETNRMGVMTRPIWKLMHKLPMYAGCIRDGQENAEYLEQRIVNIPSSYLDHGK